MQLYRDHQQTTFVMLNQFCLLTKLPHPLFLMDNIKQLDGISATIKWKTHIFFIFFFNWDSLHARLISHYKTWSYKNKKYKKIKVYRKSV